MKVVIDIPEEMYESAKTDMWCGSPTLGYAIRNGTPYKERPRGEWEQVGEMTYRCAQCGWLKKTGLMAYCENCGSDNRKRKGEQK